MITIRRAILFWALALLALLAAASAAGAFMGRGRAGAWFNSVPLAVYWAALALLLVLGLVLFRRLRCSAGLLAVHLGCLLTLAGAMYGSEAGHALAASLLGRQKIVHGFMPLDVGASGNAVLAADMRAELGRLPFTVRLKNFWIERYGPWQLVAARNESDDGVPVRWTQGMEIDIPHVLTRLKVLRYIPRARPVYPEGSSDRLEVTDAAGRVLSLPVELGREVALADPQMTLRIIGVFSRLAARTDGDRHYATDDGPLWNPAAAVELETPDGTRTPPRYAYALHPELSPPGPEGVALRYVARQPSGAIEDPNGRGPAMQLALTYRGEGLTYWLIVPYGRHEASLSPAGPNGLTFRLAKPAGPVKEYVAELAILTSGREVASGRVEVNRPLHYGGYHIYQHDCDELDEEYTVLAVRSDSGLAAVFGGFGLLAAGVCWRFWFRPALGYLARRRGQDER